MSIRSINPATGQVLKSYKEDPTKVIDSKLQLATQTQADWRRLAFSVRARYVLEVAKLLRNRKSDLAGLITAEMGKPLKESILEVEKCARVCEYYAENAKLLLKDEHVKTEAEQSYISFEPLGVVLAIMPWNFPFWQVFRCAAPALMAGNTVLLKHASNVPQCAEAITALFADAELPAGCFQHLVAGPSAIKRILTRDEIAAIAFTGSEAAGGKVAEMAGRSIKKTVLELGGSDPFIVLREANIKEAARTALKSRMVNGGQSCIAAKRIIVEKPIAATFLKVLQSEFEKLKVGDPLLSDTDIGPMAREDGLKTLYDQIRYSVKKGAKVLIGGQKPQRKGYFFKPTLVADVKPGMPLFDEEVFGPVMPVIVAENEDDALALANQSRYGLGAALWTENMELATRLVKLLETGFVVVNGMVASDPRLPFGGIKKSGYGRELGAYGIREFVNIKSVVFH